MHATFKSFTSRNDNLFADANDNSILSEANSWSSHVLGVGRKNKTSRAISCNVWKLPAFLLFRGPTPTPARIPGQFIPVVPFFSSPAIWKASHLSFYHRRLTSFPASSLHYLQLRVSSSSCLPSTSFPSFAEALDLPPSISLLLCKVNQQQTHEQIL
jgi:hypothetical protein